VQAGLCRIVASGVQMFDELLPIVRNVRRRMRKNMGGLYRTKTRQPGDYNKDSYWDERFYSTIHSDDDTNLGFNQPLITAYHYASLETAVILALSKCNKQSAEVLLDIGSGTGHWTDFFMKTYPKLKKAVLCDVSVKSFHYLQEKYASETRITVHNVLAEKVIHEDKYDIVCLIGCAFHIVRDEDINSLFQALTDSIDAHGVIIFNDLLPSISHGVEFTPRGEIFKFVRSKQRWRKLAAAADLTARFVTNYAWLRAPAPIPEGHIVYLQKR
jgi:SAM-dependent methyltransferase